MDRPAVFLDRDDTLIQSRGLPAEAFAAGRPGDMADPAFVRPLPGSLEACLNLRRAGFTLIVVTNQGVVARGGATLEQVEATNARLLKLLPDPDRPGRSLIHAALSCPHHPEGSVPPFNTEHPRRKPAPGMVLEAANRFGLDLARSWIVGDAERDAEAGRRAGIAPERCLRIGPDTPWPDLPAAGAHILRST
jgi:D-glycero-D-manno-heptose 1,7-bisphosphate phosphatase